MKHWFIVWKWKYEQASSLEWRVENTLYEGDHPLSFLKSLVQNRGGSGLLSDYRLMWWSQVESGIYDSMREVH